MKECNKYYIQACEVLKHVMGPSKAGSFQDSVSLMLLSQVFERCFRSKAHFSDDGNFSQ